MSIEECIGFEKAEVEGKRQVQSNGGFAEYHEQVANYLECLNEIAHIFLEHRAWGEYPSSADDMWEETIRVLDKYKIEIQEEE